MLIVPSREAMILKVDNPAQIYSCIPSAKPFKYKGTELVYVPHKLDETKVLRNLGIAAPSPVGYYYRYEGRTPFDHQRKTTEFLTLHMRSVVLNQPRTGKTLSSLWAADYLIQQGFVRKVLIVCPLSTVDIVWGQSIFDSMMHHKYAVLHGSRAKRMRLLKEDVRFFIVNHEGFPIIKDHLPEDVDLVIYDEAAKMRNPSSPTLYKPFARFVESRPALRIWLLTGTPTPNEPTDAWALCKLIGAKVPRYTAFRDLVMRKIAMWKWVERPEAQEIVSNYLQPSILFRRDDCFDLPDMGYETRRCELSTEQKRLYNDLLKKLATDSGGQNITAVNEAAKILKILQCIAEGTEVLTSTGWKPIEMVTACDKVWDGIEWVTCLGAICRGYRRVIDCDGVLMTPDHRVLTVTGWATAEEIYNGNASRQLNREEVRPPDGYSFRGDEYPETSNMGSKVRLRSADSPGGDKFEEQTPTKPQILRVQQEAGNAEDYRYAFKKCASTIQNLVRHTYAVFEPSKQRLGSLWRERANYLRRVAKRFRTVFSGYASDIPEGSTTRSTGQQYGVLEGQLQMGHRVRTSTQQEEQRDYRHPQRGDDSGASGSGVQPEASNNLCADKAGEHGPSAAPRQVTRVYDILNAGPRTRFTIRGTTGKVLLSHNCLLGVVYTDNAERAFVGCESRVAVIKEVIEECDEKVIVFVPFTGALEELEKELGKHFTTAAIYGKVGINARTQIFRDFMEQPNPRVLVADARTMAHGLDLSAATTIIWAGPTNSNETYEQACARILGPRQKHKTTIVHITATNIEEKIYTRLQHKQSMQGLLLDLIQANTQE